MTWTGLWTIRIAASDLAFPCGEDETVLEAAQRAGLVIPYSCRRGVCITCEGTVTAGAVAAGGSIRSTAADGGPFRVLFCSARPRSDLEIAPLRVSRAEAGTGPREVTASVYRMLRPIPEVAILHLRFPAGTRVKFRAGQYLDVILEDGSRRSFSMANPPHESDSVQLHVRVHPGGTFSDRVLSGLTTGAKLRLSLPYGDVQLSGGTERPLLLLATGTGFAPVKSIVEDALRRRSARPMALYWGGRRPADLYLGDLPAKWAARYPGLRYVPVLSRPEPGDGWTGRRGHVQQAAAEDYPDLSGAQVYACGNPTMTSAAHELFVRRHGLAPGDFYSDAFVPTAPAPKSAPA